MLAAPSAEVVQRLVGQFVDCVTFAKFTIYIAFGDKFGLTITAPFRFARGVAIDTSSLRDFPLSESDLMSIVGESVSSVAFDQDGTLHLEFSHKDVLIVYANDPQYEAYTLKLDGTEYFV